MGAPPSSDIDQSTSLDGRDKPPTTIIRTASSPFNDPKADLILRSSDNLYFCIHKSLLSIVSPVFESMLALPQETYHDGRPCLPVSDDKRHLFCLLSWCDPRCKQPSPTLDNLTMTLIMAKKYGINSIFEHAQKDLLIHDSLQHDPLRVFAIAIRFRLDSVARIAAQATLKVLLASHNSPDLMHISAFAVQNLHNYHFKCKEAVRDLLASESWAKSMKIAARRLTSSQDDIGNPHSHGVERFVLKRLAVVGGGALWLATEDTVSWWSSYVETLMHVLNEQPGVSCLSPLNWLQKSISLDRCSQCRKHGYERLDTVTQYLASIIDKTISMVPFEVKY